MVGQGSPFNNVRDVPTAIRTSIVVAAGMIAGELVFAVVAISQGWGEPPGDITIAAIMAGIVLLELPLVYIAPAIVVRNSLGRAQAHVEFKGNEREFAATVYQTQMIIKLALIEGACFANLMGFMIAHYQWSLGIAAGLVMSQLMMFPTKNRIETWIDDQLRRLDDRSEWSS